MHTRRSARGAARPAVERSTWHPPPGSTDDRSRFPLVGPTSLSDVERRALADIRDGLEAGDAPLVREFHRLDRGPSRWWWLATAGVIAAVAAAVLAFGPMALGVVVLLLVLAAPVLVAVASGPPDRTGPHRQR